MKKIMLAVAAVALAAVANAGSVTWKINYVVNPTSGEDYTGGIAYLFNAADVTSTVVAAALADGTFGTSDYASMAVYNDSFEAGTISNANILNGVYSGATTFYSVILDGTYDYANGGNYIVTSDIQQTIGSSGSKPYKWDMEGTTTEWTAYGTSGVPEPTSGLMLLLGVAGLALRRKQK